MENRIEYMRPDQILDAQRDKSIVYAVFAPLEWHSPSLPIGCDPLTGREVARRAAALTGGVLMPTFFMGSDIELPPDLKKGILKAAPDISDDTYIMGMDLPNNSMKSYYVREEVVGIIMREQVRMLVAHEYKLIVLICSHGGASHINTAKRIARETTEETTAKVIVPDIIAKLGRSGEVIGHATTLEHSVMMTLTNSVDMKKLPPLPEKLKYCDMGMMEADMTDGTVRDDPRINASAELGEEYLAAMGKFVARQVDEAYAR